MTQAANLAKGVGTSANQVVALDSTGKLPAVDGSQLTNISVGGLIRAPRVLTTGTSYTTPVNCNAVFVELVGGGGAGSGGVNSSGAGGGGAGCFIARYFAVSPNTAYSYTIGAGATTSGGSGGSTTFTAAASTSTANGGSGGSGVTPGAGGTGTAGSAQALNLDGAAGGPGYAASTTWVSGAGGNTPFGSGGRIVAGTTSTNGIAGLGYGSGGSGAIGLSGGGGAGADGVIRIWEYT